MTRARLMVLAVVLCSMIGCSGADDDGSSASAEGTGSTVADGTTTTTAAVDRVEVETAATYDIEFHRDVAFAEAETAAGPMTLQLDWVEPVDADGLRPVAVLLHGGGWTSGVRQSPGLMALVSDLAARGFVALSADYRLAGDDPVPSERVQPLLDAIGGPESPALQRAGVASVEDTLSVFDWLAEHAEEYALDLDRVVVGGGSAGAITAATTVYAADSMGVEVPPVDAVINLWGGVLDAPEIGVAGPEGVVEADDPSVFSVHGDADEEVPISWSERLTAAAAAVGLDAVLVSAPGAGHGFVAIDLAEIETPDGTPALDALYAFLARTVVAD